MKILFLAFFLTLAGCAARVDPQPQRTDLYCLLVKYPKYFGEMPVLNCTDLETWGEWNEEREREQREGASDMPL